MECSGRAHPSRVAGWIISVDLDTTVVEAIVRWARWNWNVREIWLFGSRARGDSRPDSNVDLALTLVEADWAQTNFVAFVDDWQRQLAELVAADVSLQLMGGLPNEARATAIRLWARG